ncbi:hypothetical protein AK830_g4717 [Neonectria ditissima]|uniref:FAD-binding domain-containing protein n=1 Tax=Neonectria ditissima TaxID=78410 RepID=A0A0P7BMD5_9HYPO|nr:hypothetical protein AK830_g4717 [Neonectria ditissima]
MVVPTKPVIIIGAGVVGLTLANALKKASIPFHIYERDQHISSRGQGWAITLHWVLPFLRKLLSPKILDEIDSVQVDPNVARLGTGNFVFINLETLEPKFRIPPSERRRVNREKLRNVLLQEVSDCVHWGKRLATIEDVDGGVVAVFDDGTRVEGAIIVGAEGSNSCTRKFVAPDTYRNTRLPVRFVGCSVDLTPEQVKPLKEIDPLLFQGCHPTSGNFLWVSLLETAEANGTKGTNRETCRMQINISWLMKSPADEVKPTDAERLAEMKRRAEDFHQVLRDAVHAIPDGSEVIEIVLQDWPCLEWDNHGGKVTLAGDAAHAMTMYRGEAANHGILDAYSLWEALDGVYNKGMDLEESIAGYEAELRERTRTAVLLSRQACLDAHDWFGLNEGSAVLKRRAIRDV